MTEPRSDDRAQARREAATLLGVDIEHLSPADNLRVDMVSALRLVIDSEQATVLDGNSADLGKLNVAVQSLIALLPGQALPEPASNREDPRAYMWRTYLEMRRRGELGDKQREPTLRSRLTALEAENESLRAASSTAITPTPPTSDIVPPGERSECDPGPRPGPDDLLKRAPVTIEGELVKPKGKAVPAPPAPAADMVVDLRASRANGAGGSAGFRVGPADDPWRRH
jgi:hypothetical protein